MASELKLKWTETGINVYAIVYNATGQAWNTSGSAYESFTAANIADYDTALTETNATSRWYVGDMPAGAASAAYSITYHKRAGGSPVVGDQLIGTEDYRPNAAAVTTIQSGLATSTAQTTAQNDLDLLTGTDGATLATLQGNYAPAKVADVPTVVQNRQEMDSNSTKLANLDATISSRSTVAAILAGIVDGAVTLKVALRRILAGVAGTSEGNEGANPIYKSPAGTKDRLQATVDADGNRTAITYDDTDE